MNKNEQIININSIYHMLQQCFRKYSTSSKSIEELEKKIEMLEKMEQKVEMLEKRVPKNRGFRVPCVYGRSIIYFGVFFVGYCIVGPKVYGHMW